MKTIKVKLDDPIEVDGKQVTELEIRKPTVRELRHAKERAGDDMLERTIVMVGDLSVLAPDQVDLLTVMDFLKIQEEMEKAGFLPKSPKQQKS